MLNVIMLSVVFNLLLCMSVIMLNVVMLSDVMLNVIMLSVVMLNVVAHIINLDPCLIKQMKSIFCFIYLLMLFILLIPPDATNRFYSNPIPRDDMAIVLPPPPPQRYSASLCKTTV